ncbi:head-tail connector protein [Pseudotabrizicola alkalilacus]|uniref:PhiE125 gp8 family phage protein n=1 Tax=Pseudotabrizicola alkalilacus TaxID=2305252 RepID=A0A411Z1V3_9RHOB|nr:hypothetical protein [Pseudotabrizicola alkalilacus]RGP37044.1 hypothetical protein D1012_11700 [Pseudotabrizicola alkalilacus]
MMLTEQTVVPPEALPVQAMKDHLRLGTGFADDGLQDGLVVAHLRAAIAAIEGRTGKALLARRFLLRLNRWREDRGAQALPMAPVSALVSVTVRDANGEGVLVASDRYRLEPDMARPRLRGAGRSLPGIPEDGTVEIVFDAGFGTGWDAVPADLAQAVLLLAAEFYEVRHSGAQGGPALPLAVQALIERWRTVRVLGGGSA